MKLQKPMSYLCSQFRLFNAARAMATMLLTGLSLLCTSHAFAANTNVSIVDFGFSPANVVIKPNDSVTWSWNGAFSHSSTSDNTNLWNSGVNGNGATFSHTFAAAGDFPYHCLVHSLTMKGSVTVQTQAQPNSPPVASILSPVNGSVFSAPWTGTIAASSSDSDGTVSRLQVFSGTTLLSSITNPPSNSTLNITNLPAGNYTLTVVATDNGGATSPPAVINVVVASPAPVSVSLFQASPGAFSFSYTTTPGLSYVIQRGTDLFGWSALATNKASAGSATFTDSAAGNPFNFYRVTLAPNP
jgi:plastocyanin